MPVEPKTVMGWIDVMRAGGPYIVILGLLVIVVFLVRELWRKDKVVTEKDEAIRDLNKLIYSTNNLRLEDQKKLTDTLLADAKESTKATTELTAAMNSLKERIKEGK